MELPRLKEVRELHGWSQAKLAEESGVSRDSISNYETGQREPWPATAKRLADALGVEIEDLARPKVTAPSTSGQPETFAQNDEEFERALARVLEPVRTEALLEQQAVNRTLSSEGRPQRFVGDIPEAQAGNRFLDEFSPDERPRAFGELALGYARIERDNTNLREALRERDRKRDREIARLEEKAARLEEENARLREEAKQNA